MTLHKPTRAAFRFTGDHALGVTGVCLAAGSAVFGIGMALHGPAASFGTGKDFTVFAQFAPHTAKPVDRPAMPDGTKNGIEDLDMTATASIPKSDAVSPDAGDAAIIPAVTLEAVGTDSATVVIGGSSRVVRVGDEVPGAGHVIAILPGAKPMLKTSRGLIVPAAE